jgi:serine protease Do
MNRVGFLFLAFFLALPVCVFSQQQSASASALRDYVGMINQSYHPGIVSFFEKIKEELVKQGDNETVRAIDAFLSGSSGSGFVYAGAGNFYVITNYHVVANAYSLAITFERQDGSKRKIENLKIIAADEEIDLAVLALPAGERPSAGGLSFLSRAVEEGEPVYSAGFPGLGIMSIWQFGQGIVSNASVRFPKSLSDETLMGPFIQHTAQVDPGNSGGPLLAAQRNVPSGYAVAGINTLKGVGRQAANYAIPVSTARAFIDNAVNPKPQDFREALDKRLEIFTKGLAVNRAVYPHIAEFLSAVCIGENAEYAISEMYDRGNRSVRRAFIEKCREGVVGAMGYAVAWTIEDNIRSGGMLGALRASVKEVSGGGQEYTVVFTVNNREISSQWIYEYGNWRIKSFGTVAAGDPSLIEKKQAQKNEKPRLRLDNNTHIEAGFATLFGKAPTAFYASLEFMPIFTLGVRTYIAGADFWTFGAFFGYRWEIPSGKFGFMPYIRMGVDYQSDQEYETYKGDFGPASISIAGQAGLKVTSSYAPGLFLGAAFQYNLFNMHSFVSTRYKNPMKIGLSATAGYAF